MSYAYDPQIQPVVDYLPVIALSDIDGTRSMLAAASEQFPPYAPGEGIVQETISAEYQGTQVQLLVIRPEARSQDAAPAVLWFHGGGFVLGDASESLPFLEQVVLATGAVGISVQYQLSPEANYPVAVNQGAAAARWVAEHHDQLGIDPQRIALGGQSAGGAYAAGLALKLRDEQGPAICQLVLDVPVTDDAVATESVLAYTDTPMWDTDNARRSWHAYLAGAQADQYAAPARAADLSGMPPTFIAVNQFDPLRDEGLEFARRLAQANVPTEAHLYAGTFHASAALAPQAEVSIRQLQDLTAAFARAFAANILEEAK
ncbi:esterase [Glutamicibacter uratoxydans]|uniref:Esterase n=1 Tax=Glutamicibacter uratoxydans TaxID=43667 RepID=A0A4Y4DKS8_GLUUR|nr:alpha/beta hydrolase [Glutamicibacter uratoxydans]GED05203.1 esterase [Glutamicibacter uratoxydans]